VPPLSFSLLLPPGLSRKTSAAAAADLLGRRLARGDSGHSSLSGGSDAGWEGDRSARRAVASCSGLRQVHSGPRARTGHDLYVLAVSVDESGAPGLVPQHEDAWDNGPRHGGGGLLLCRRCSTGFVASLTDLVIRHLVSDGKVWLPVKTETALSYRGRWRHLRAGTSMKDSLMQSFCLLAQAAPGETPGVGPP
jgi:hypothetical protein